MNVKSDIKEMFFFRFLWLVTPSIPHLQLSNFFLYPLQSLHNAHLLSIALYYMWILTKIYANNPSLDGYDYLQNFLHSSYVQKLQIVSKLAYITSELWSPHNLTPFSYKSCGKKEYPTTKWFRWKRTDLKDL